MRVRLLIILLGLVFLLPQQISLAQDDVADVLWLSNGQLWLNDRLLVPENVLDAALAPDGEHVAYISLRDTSNATLVLHKVAEGRAVVSLSNTDLPPSDLGLVQFSAPQWLHNDAIVFQSVVLFGGPGGIRNLNDLYQLDIEGMLITHRTRGEGGRIVLSPDQSHLALLRAGVYEDTTQLGAIEMLDSSTFQTIGEPFYFDAVSTGSITEWLPALAWHEDSQSLAFVIPPPDLLYAAPTELTPSRLCTMTLGQSRCDAELMIGFPAHAVWSADLSRVAFQRPVALNEWEVVIWQDGAERSLPPTTDLPETLFWLDAETLILREIGATEVSYAYCRDGVLSTWEMPILDIAPFQDGQVLLALGNYGRFRIEIYDPIRESRQELAQHEGGFPQFVVN